MVRDGTQIAVIEEAFRPLGVPLVMDLPFGHGARNAPWPFGGRGRIDGDAGTVAWLEPAVDGDG